MMDDKNDEDKRKDKKADKHFHQSRIAITYVSAHPLLLEQTSNFPFE